MTKDPIKIPYAFPILLSPDQIFTAFVSSAFPNYWCKSKYGNDIIALPSPNKIKPKEKNTKAED